MSWKCTWRVRCERCHALGPLAESSSKVAEDKAVSVGWKKGQCYGMALHLCPACVAEGLPDWWPDGTGVVFHWENGEKS